jgi:hypothetical protein
MKTPRLRFVCLLLLPLAGCGLGPPAERADGRFPPPEPSPNVPAGRGSTAKPDDRPDDAEGQAVKAVQELHAALDYDDAAPGRPVVGMCLSFSRRMTAEDFQPIAGLKRLRTLNLSGNSWLTDEGLNAVADLKDLQELDLTGTKVTDAGLKVLAGIKSLRQVGLSDTAVTDAGVADLQKALPDCKIDRSRTPWSEVKDKFLNDR